MPVRLLRRLTGTACGRRPVAARARGVSLPQRAFIGGRVGNTRRPRHQRQVTCVRPVNHTACRFAEKRGFSAHFGPGGAVPPLPTCIRKLLFPGLAARNPGKAVFRAGRRLSGINRAPRLHVRQTLPQAICPASAPASACRAASGVIRDGAGGSAAVEMSGTVPLTGTAASGILKPVL